MTLAKFSLALTGLASALLLAGPAAQAEMMTFTAVLNGSSEVPSTGSAATGSAEVLVDTDAKKVTWPVKSDTLSGDPTAAHIHGPASASQKAPPVIDMSTAIMQGSADITESQISDLKAGKYYVNVHTAMFPDGEIRGQLVAMK